MSVKCYESVYKNFGNCICLENDKLILMASLDFGPRIIYFGLKGEENILFEDNERNFTMDIEGYGRWYAYGGHRIWKSPETVPETYFPDNEKVNYLFEDNELELTQSVTPFGKQFSLICIMNEDGSVNVESRIKNCLDKPQRFAPWSVTSLAPGGTEYIELCSDETGFLPNRVISLWPYSKISDERFSLTDKTAVLKQDNNAEDAFKVGFNITSGSVRYINGTQTFVKCFEDYSSSYNYPDFSCNFETYTNKYFLECEITGDDREYMPYETAVIKEKWILKRTGEN